MRPGDALLKRKVRSEFIKRELNTNALEVNVIHGVAYLSGELRGSRAHKVPDWKKEMALIESIIWQISGIRGIDNRVKCFDL
ncbi:MAG: BON domain-containing protein [Armatimonadetes bacterium]|nr:BON domain-containing protein [Armatimonadota bacterium]